MDDLSSDFYLDSLPSDFYLDNLPEGNLDDLPSSGRLDRFPTTFHRLFALAVKNHHYILYFAIDSMVYFATQRLCVTTYLYELWSHTERPLS